MGWAELAESDFPRRYHSISILLSDARILTAGGDSLSGWVGNQNNADIFEPPYLFAEGTGGQYAQRPLVGQAPASVGYDQTFKITLSIAGPDASDIAHVNLIRNGAVTHSHDQGQLFIPLSFAPDPMSDHALLVTSPESANIAPPGPYMLFVVSKPGANAYGVPSVARFIMLE